MLDINFIREHPEELRKALTDRQMDSSVVDKLLTMDAERRGLLVKVENLKALRNTVSKEISQTKDPAERQEKIDAMRSVGEEIAQLDETTRQVDEGLQALLATIPNLPDPSTPIGKDESENIVLRTHGALPKFDFTPLPHWELGPKMGLIDFDRGVKLTGSRFYVLNGEAARLQRALISWMLDLHARQGYVERYTPFMVKAETLYAAGQLPKFVDNLYHEDRKSVV